MPTPAQENEADLRPEYDFRQLRVVARGPNRKASQGDTVELAPDVAVAFPDADAVNEALTVPNFDESAMRALVGCARGRLGQTAAEWLDETRGGVVDDEDR